MDDKIAMKVPDCSRNLSKVERSQALLTIVSFSYFFEQASVGCQLKKQIDFVLI